MSEQMIPLGSIDDPEFNSRLSADPKGIKELAASMPTPDKMIQAVTVEPNGDRFLLVAGSRRVAAARLNAWSEIRANVRPKTDEATRILDNYVENNQRHDLSLFEQARSIAKMKEAGLPGTEIAAATGNSPQKVSNLIGMYTRLPPQIHEEWRQGHKAATFEFLQSLAVIKGKTPEVINEKQVQLWNDRAKLFEKFDDKLAPPARAANGTAEAKKECKVTAGCTKEKGHEGECKTPTDPPYKVSHQRYYDITRACQKAKLPKIVFDVMEALVGNKNKIKTVWDPATGTQDTQ